MRKLLLSIFLAASSLSSANAVDIKQPSGVVEIFTSQGCYSCPPADKLVGKFSKTNDVLALSWHVDYWDYLGWKDSFASKVNTQRQYDYARALKERQVYTPQAVINGRSHAVGSNESDIKNALSKFGNSSRGMIVPIKASLNNKSLNIKIDDNVNSNDATLYMVFFNKEHKVKIKRGENGGKTLSYHNVVHGSQALGIVKADGFDMNYPVAEIKKLGFDGCALILQKLDANGNPAAIIGATVITDL